MHDINKSLATVLQYQIINIQLYQITIYVTGTDISAEFGTIHRDKLLEIAKESLSQDGARMLGVLLTNTNIDIKTKDALTTPFTSNIGTLQGQSCSRPQLDLYFENVLRKVRMETGITNQKYLPGEIIYVDEYGNLTDRKSMQDMF